MKDDRYVIKCGCGQYLLRNVAGTGLTVDEQKTATRFPTRADALLARPILPVGHWRVVRLVPRGGRRTPRPA